MRSRITKQQECAPDEIEISYGFSSSKREEGVLGELDVRFTIRIQYSRDQFVT